MSIRLLYLIVAVFGLSGCAIGYKSWVPGGGISDHQLARDRYKITYAGNQFNTVEGSNFYVRVRAAELAVQNGYTHFALKGTVTNVSQIAVGYAAPGVAFPIPTDKPYGCVIAVLMNQKTPESFEARPLLQEAIRKGLPLDQATKDKM